MGGCKNRNRVIFALDTISAVYGPRVNRKSVTRCPFMSQLMTAWPWELVLFLSHTQRDAKQEACQGRCSSSAGFPPAHPPQPRGSFQVWPGAKASLVPEKSRVEREGGWGPYIGEGGHGMQMEGQGQRWRSKVGRGQAEKRGASQWRPKPAWAVETERSPLRPGGSACGHWLSAAVALYGRGGRAGVHAPPAREGPPPPCGNSPLLSRRGTLQSA